MRTRLLAHPSPGRSLRSASYLCVTSLALFTPTTVFGQSALPERFRLISDSPALPALNAPPLFQPESPPLTGTGRWTWVPGPITVRKFHTAVYDPDRDQMLVFGGIDRMFFVNDTWALTFGGTPAWNPLLPSGAPPSPRRSHSAIYDPVRDRMIVFGGYCGTDLNDLWQLSLAGDPAWNRMSPVGEAPHGRSGHTAIYDSMRDRMIVFGGASYHVTYNDVWELALTDPPVWTRLTTVGEPPVPVVFHSAIYDPVGDRMIAFGGWDGSAYRNEVWELSLSGTPRWTQLAPLGTPPQARGHHRAIYDPLRERMVMYGGSYDPEDLWELSLAGTTAWTRLAAENPPSRGRGFHSAIYRARGDCMVVFGGFDGAVHPNDVLALSLSHPLAWARLLSASAGPIAHAMHTAIYDPPRERMIVFAGEGGPTNDLWALSLRDPPTWEAVAPLGPLPGYREGHTAILDPVRERMVVFGGWEEWSPLFGDVWMLSLAGTPTWSELAPRDPWPGARTNHSAVYDPVRDRMIVFGGTDWEGPLNDVWALSLASEAAWTPLAPLGTPPPPRMGHTAIYDPVGDRMVIFGGALLSDVWALSLSGTPTWTEVRPPGPGPTPRMFHSAVYEPVRQRMIMFGGMSDGPFSDVWALSLSQAPSWAELSPSGILPGGRYGHAAILHPVSGHPLETRMTVYGGADISARDALWELDWKGGRALPLLSAAAPLSFVAQDPNPVSAEAVIRFSARESTPVTLSIYDVAGREVRRLLDTRVSPGDHAISWDLTTGRGDRAAPGVYYYAVRTAEQHLVGRIVVLR